MMEVKRGNEARTDMTLDENVSGGTLQESLGESDETPSRRSKLFSGAALGYTAFAIAVVLVIAEGVAINLATNGQPVTATAIGQVLVVLTALPLALGLFVALRGPKREWGIAAMVVAVIANPLILLNVLSFFGTI